MKIISDKWQVTSDTNRQPARSESASSCHLSPVTCHRQRGVALVITLILLSVTLLMALAFLAISKRERGAVTTSVDTATARLAADAGQQFAEAEIAANILSTTNPYGFGPFVSVNYQPTSPQVWLSNIVTHAPENRFYLDLNRNGTNDPSGPVTDVDNQGHTIFDSSGTNPIVEFQVGDPEWIGVLQRPDQPYGPDNPYIARFAVFAQPVGNSLDWNAIHNQALSPAKNTKQPNPIQPDYYFRNEGVGSWELNLPAFLTDLNTNEWDPATDPYNYLQPGFINKGRGFEDAFALLTNRYAGRYTTLLSVTNLFGAAGGWAFANDGIDGYSDGPQLITADTNEDLFQPDSPIEFWLGANNTNHFFTPDDLFDPAKSSVYFTNSLTSAGFSNATYDRYTFYRMLSQIGTDTTPESGKMNLNYDNLDPGFNGVLTVNGTASATNFIPWQPLAFFANAADRMLKTYTTLWSTSYVPTNSAPGVTNLIAVVNPNYVATFNVTAPFGVTGIPVWVSNRFVYTPAVQRVLQLAANIFDATTNSYYPSVFRPMFTVSASGNVFITGYTNVPAITDPTQLVWPIDASTLSAMSAVTNVNNLAINVFGVPWIIGAKKGFPNFNAFEMENIFQLTRKLQLTRPNINVTYQSNPNAYAVSQQITITMTNMFGVECWNSYQADYTHGLVQIVAKDFNTVTLTNDEGLSYTIPFASTNAVADNDWPGCGPNPLNLPIQPNPQSFIWQPLEQGEIALPGWIYTFDTNNPFVAQAPSYFVTNSLMPHWTLLVTNRLQVVILESNAVDGAYHVLDYVQLIGPEKSIDLTAAITNLYDTYYDINNHYQPTQNTGYNDMWDPITNRAVPRIPKGIINQIAVSAQFLPIVYSPWWNGSGWAPVDVTNQTAAFGAFLGYGSSVSGDSSYIAAGGTALSLQAPYTPTALVACITQWEVNDPLVHYLASDLAGASQSAQPVQQITPLTLGGLNDRYRPWGGNVRFQNIDLHPYDHTIKDPLVSSSDHWDFPASKLPTTGWLGRIHRGTPWQTVYLKSLDVLATDGLGTWTNWTGDLNYFDAAAEAPVQDRLLFDVFTTAFNDNATRGTLPVNIGATPGGQSLAAWSALFSGIVAPTNIAGGYTIINPVAVDVANGVPMTNSPLWQLAAGIVNARSGFINPDGLAGVYEHAGSILRAPQLTELSPFLSALNPTNQISDEMYEWLPQQIMSLLRVGAPRYVIYSYGQTLKPAQGGVFLGAGANFGMVTNYQVAAEIATRTVVRMDTMRTNTASGAVTVTPPHAVIESFNILPPD